MISPTGDMYGSKMEGIARMKEFEILVGGTRGFADMPITRSAIPQMDPLSG